MAYPLRIVLVRALSAVAGKPKVMSDLGLEPTQSITLTPQFKACDVSAAAQ